MRHDSASFLIGASSKLLITKIGLKYRIRSISCQIGLFASQLPLSVEYFPIDIYLLGQLTSLYQILYEGSFGCRKCCIPFFGHICSKLWFPWQPKSPIDLYWVKCGGHDSTFILIRYSLNVQITRTGIKSWTNSITGQIGLLATLILALECGNVLPYTYNGENYVDTITPCVLIGSSSN